jgi:uncharacterized protein (DUF427 family)
VKAIWNRAVIAESDKTIVIEGNQYFPPESVRREFLMDSDLHTTCVWKGEASYYTLMVEGEENQDGAWYYPKPKDGSIEMAGHDFTDYVAFWRGVEVKN